MGLRQPLWVDGTDEYNEVAIPETVELLSGFSFRSLISDGSRLRLRDVDPSGTTTALADGTVIGMASDEAEGRPEGGYYFVVDPASGSVLVPYLNDHAGTTVAAFVRPMRAWVDDVMVRFDGVGHRTIESVVSDAR